MSLTKEGVAQMKVTDLKAELGKLGLDQKGKKAQLAKRLLEAISAPPSSTDDGAADTDAEAPEAEAPEAEAPEAEAPAEAPDAEAPDGEAQAEATEAEAQAEAAALAAQHEAASLAAAQKEAAADRAEQQQAGQAQRAAQQDAAARKAANEKAELAAAKKEAAAAAREEAEQAAAEEEERQATARSKALKDAAAKEAAVQQAAAQVEAAKMAAAARAATQLEAAKAAALTNALAKAQEQAQVVAAAQAKAESKASPMEGTEVAAGDATDGKKKKKPTKKRRKKRAYNEPTKQMDEPSIALAAPGTGGQDVLDPKKKVTVEYVPESMSTVAAADPIYAEFNAIFSKFKEEEKPEEPEAKKEVKDKKKEKKLAEDDDDDDDELDGKTSKSALRRLNRLTVAELKQLVDRPDVIEVQDVTAADPKLLVLLKATRNTVPVPKHWLQKRKYLQNKRGIEKAPFELPDYIAKTGIMEMREALQEKEERMGLKGKQREKSRPKMGKMDIDYQKLHDAFFRWQTKPKMSRHGEMYYEGKEYETKVVDRKPGNLTDELKAALGMPVGEDTTPIPPPWLLHMQRYGPPPSYPNLKIPGLNSPIPEGAQFGFHPGGWGKPPVNEYGVPLYGNVFSTSNTELESKVVEVEVSTDLWGQLESEEEESSSDEDSSDGEDGEGDVAGDGDQEGTITPSGYTSETPSGITSVNTGLETPDALELRKRRIEDDMEDGTEGPALYKVLEQKDVLGGTQGIMGSSHVYDVGAAAKKGKKGADGEGIELAVNDPEELANMDEEALKARYDQAQAAKEGEKEDFSDLVAEHTSKQAKKRKAAAAKQADKAAKKFKF